MFGPDIMVAPVVTAANATTNLADKLVWVPPGRWVEHVSGTVFDGADVRLPFSVIFHVPVRLLIRLSYLAASFSSIHFRE